VIGVGLRLEALGAHLSNDEGYSYPVGSAPSSGAFLGRLAAYENTPPLFYLLLSALPLDHAAWLRFPALVPGALIPLVLYRALRQPLGVRAALLAAAIVAVASYHVSYSNYARGFMLEDLGCMLACGRCCGWPTGGVGAGGCCTWPGACSRSTPSTSPRSSWRP
jgi:uncharacterized membrane protein